jgi:16S rRNA (guanine966-N2)-methyltransferase
MTRIIGGTAGGRRLVVPPGRDTRPTTDRVREALFSRLEHDGWLTGTRVLDLYAGSGALGLEAASRGAREVLLVESARSAAGVLRANVGGSGLAGAALLTVRVARVERVLAEAPTDPYDLVLADPPYPLPDADLAAVLTALVAGGWLADHAAVVVERSARSACPTWPVGLRPVHDRSYGLARLWFAEHERR